MKVAGLIPYIPRLPLKIGRGAVYTRALPSRLNTVLRMLVQRVFYIIVSSRTEQTMIILLSICTEF